MDKNNTEARLSMEFDKSINRLGRYTSIIALAFMLSVPLVTQIYYGLDINFTDVLIASSSLIAMFLPMAVVENISYYPIIGAGGIYLGSITGNVLNMKLPCAIAGMKIANVEPGTKEGDVISIIAIGVSSVVTIFIVLGNKKLSVVPVILALVAYLIIGANFGMYQSYVLIVVMILSVGSAYLNYRKSKHEEE